MRLYSECVAGSMLSYRSGVYKMAISLVAVDLSKSVFQLSLADAKHHIITRKRLNRAQFHRVLVQS